MANRKIEVETIQAYGRTFIKGNIPEINPARCQGCTHCIALCRQLGPNVLELRNGIATVVRPENCISDGACLLSCPTKALFLVSGCHPAGPPTPVT